MLFPTAKESHISVILDNYKFDLMGRLNKRSQTKTFKMVVVVVVIVVVMVVDVLMVVVVVVIVGGDGCGDGGGCVDGGCGGDGGCSGGDSGW